LIQPHKHSNRRVTLAKMLSDLSNELAAISDAITKVDGIGEKIFRDVVAPCAT
jgi:hypothetical protein